MATARTTKTQKVTMPPPETPTSEVLAAAAQQEKMKEPLTGGNITVLPQWKYDEEAEQLAANVRKKGLALAEKILDNVSGLPCSVGQIDMALKAIELYKAFK